MRDDKRGILEIMRCSNSLRLGLGQFFFKGWIRDRMYSCLLFRVNAALNKTLILRRIRKTSNTRINFR